MSMQNVTQVTPTAVEAQGKAFVDFVKRFTITPADLTAGVYKIPVDAGLTVLAVRARVATVFNGTTPTAKIGDSADDDGYIKAAQLDLDAAEGTFVNSQTLGLMSAITTADTWTPNEYSSGKHYVSTNALVVTVAGSPSTGSLVVDVVFEGAGTGPARGEIKNLS